MKPEKPLTFITQKAALGFEFTCRISIIKTSACFGNGVVPLHLGLAVWFPGCCLDAGFLSLVRGTHLLVRVQKETKGRLCVALGPQAAQPSARGSPPPPAPAHGGAVMRSYRALCFFEPSTNKTDILALSASQE